MTEGAVDAAANLYELGCEVASREGTERSAVLTEGYIRCVCVCVCVCACNLLVGCCYVLCLLVCRDYEGVVNDVVSLIERGQL